MVKGRNTGYWQSERLAAREACRLMREREREENADKGDDGLDLTIPPRLRRRMRCPLNEIERS